MRLGRGGWAGVLLFSGLRGVLPGFAFALGPEFWGVLPGFRVFWGVLLLLLQFDFWIWGRAGFWLGWAVLGWAVFLLLWILGTAGGFCFLLLLFWLGWAAAGLGWAGLSSRTF